MGPITQYRVIHVPSETVLLDSISYASSPLALAVGLIGSRGGRASLWLPHTSTIHTFGMRYALDLLFLSGDGVVLRTEFGVPAGRLLIGPRGTKAVLETKSLTPSVLTFVRTSDRVRLERIESPASGTVRHYDPL
jgi:uncharacterized membrane protein (UPF0127 family)